jgi:hypothetical protein
MTYNEVELPAKDLLMSAGHMMKGLGNSAAQVGNGCFLKKQKYILIIFIFYLFLTEYI